VTVPVPAPAHPRRRWPWFLGGLAVLAIPAALLVANGCTPVVITDAIASQNGADVRIERSIPWNRYADVSFRMACTVVLVRADGSRHLLYDTDDGSLGHRVSVQAMAGTAGHLLTVRAADGRTLATTRFRFE
jgi:hypothetical protein